MAKIAVVTGFILIVLGVVGYVTTPIETVDAVLGESIEPKKPSSTALIPAFFGVPILLFGLLGAMKPNLNKHAMHGAVTFALLGGLAASYRVVMSLVKLIKADGDFNGRAFFYVGLMAVICLVFVVACVKSFINARKAREAVA